MTLLIVFNDGTERRVENVRTAGLESVDCFMLTGGGTIAVGRLFRKRMLDILVQKSCGLSRRRLLIGMRLWLA